MKITLFSIITGLKIAVVFLFIVIGPGPFNLFPYLINEYVWSAGIEESAFVKIFDITSAIVLFWIVYILVKRFLKKIINQQQNG